MMPFKRINARWCSYICRDSLCGWHRIEKNGVGRSSLSDNQRPIIVCKLSKSQYCERDKYHTGMCRHDLLVQPVLHQLLFEDLMGDTVESLTGDKVDNTHCSPLIQSFHCRRSSGLSSMTSPWWMHADNSWSPFCPSSAWKWFPGLVVPTPSQGWRWVWPACGSLGPPSCPSSRWEWHLLSPSHQASLPIAMMSERFLRVTFISSSCVLHHEFYLQCSRYFHIVIFTE